MKSQQNIFFGVIFLEGKRQIFSRSNTLKSSNISKLFFVDFNESRLFFNQGINFTPTNMIKHVMNLTKQRLVTSFNESNDDLYNQDSNPNPPTPRRAYALCLMIKYPNNTLSNWIKSLNMCSHILLMIILVFLKAKLFYI